MIEREDYSDVGEIEAEDAASTEPAVLKTRPYPAALPPEAFRGLLGDFVNLVEPHTEADPAALLIQALAAFGSLIGRSACFVADGAAHHTNLFAVIVAASSKGRKGTAWARVRETFSGIDPSWNVVSGLSSGEGLIWHVRDATPGSGGRQEADLGISDKRLFVCEPEFARVLKVCGREGATLSAVLREAWDTGSLASLTRNSPTRATDAHISVIGHITAEELRRYLTATEAGNGFGNRFLWVCAKRSKCLPDGGYPNRTRLANLQQDLSEVAGRARTMGALRRADAGRDWWHRAYPHLSAGRPGLLGSMTGRAEAQVMRLACLYAAADGRSAIDVPHLDAAQAVWRYCFASAQFIFGTSLGDRAADDLLAALDETGAAGLTRTEITDKVFGRNRSRTEVNQGLRTLTELGLARGVVERNGTGRPVERWFSVNGDRTN